MRVSLGRAVQSWMQPKPDEPIWAWARDNVDFGRIPSYDTPLHGPYDPDLIPQWKEISENDTDLSIRECWVVKPSRGGGSENAFCNGIRYHVAVDPAPLFYLSADQRSVEEFMEHRIKLGLRAVPECAAKLSRARAVEHWIKFEDMMLVTHWPKSKTAFKQSGWAVIYADEWSLVQGASATMLRKRASTYAMSYICGISSMDPNAKRASRDDPILLEFKHGDQREWMMSDPKTGNLFKWELGGEDFTYGLKWDNAAKDDAGLWILDSVKESAHYVTPDGTRINESARMTVTRTGEWIPQNPDAPAAVRSYHLNAFGLPFSDCSFPEIAATWCRIDNLREMTSEHSVEYRTQLKAFVYEYLAEEWRDKASRTEESEVRDREALYNKGELVSEVEPYANIHVGKKILVLLTADVQKANIWCVVREWIDGGDSGLIDWRSVILWEDFEKLAQEVGAAQVYIDARYKLRRQEVFEYCAEWGGFPTFGADSRISLAYSQRLIDPFEGKSGQGTHSLTSYTFDTDIFKSLLRDMITGHSPRAWMVYRNIEREYYRQVASEERVEGVWVLRHGYPNNHLWDCEVLQLLGATIEGFYYHEWLANEESEEGNG